MRLLNALEKGAEAVNGKCHQGRSVFKFLVRKLVTALIDKRLRNAIRKSEPLENVHPLARRENAPFIKQNKTFPALRKGSSCSRTIATLAPASEGIAKRRGFDSGEKITGAFCWHPEPSLWL